MFSKRLLYLSNQQLTAWDWHKGSLQDSPQSFNHDDEGYSNFALWLKEKPRTPIYILTDLIEENFQRDHVPHVSGAAHQRVLERRMTQLYRETPFRHASRQERDKQGRRDDLVLFSALTNADLLQPWIRQISRIHAPLVGIYSVALLGSLLFRKLKLDIEHLLLVTRQSNGLRQSYFLHGRLRFSRLVPMSDDPNQALAQKMVSEINKTRQFLASTRLLARDEKINIGILAHELVLEEIENASEELRLQDHQYFDLAHACDLLGVKVNGELRFADHLFLSVLAKHPPHNHYAPPGQNKHYKLLQLQIAAYSLAAFSAVSGAYLFVDNCRQIWQSWQQTTSFDSDALLARNEYNKVMSTLPGMVGNPHDMKSAVDIEEMISKNAARPLPMFREVSRVLDISPQIRVNQMQWLVSDTDNPNLSSASGQTQQALANGPPPTPALVGIPKAPFQVMVIEGEVLPFMNDYRQAMETVQNFVQELSKQKQLKVSVSKWPLDLQPNTGLKGRAGSADPDARAQFSIKLIFTPGG